MSSYADLEESMQDLLIDICAVLHERGYTHVNIGAVMRLLGVSNERAALHDDDYFELDDSFHALLKIRNTDVPPQAPPDVTLH